jgi:type IV pilus assembly protein PilB
MKSDYNNKILEIIKDKKLLDDKNLNYVIEKLKENKSLNIDTIIKNTQIIDAEKYAKLKSDIIGVPYKNLIDEKIEEDVLKILPVNLSKNYKMVIFKKTGNVLDVGLVDPGDFSAVEAVEFLAHKKNYTTRYYIISENSFNHVLGKSEDIVQEVGEVLDYAKEKLGKSVSDSDIEEVKVDSNENFDEIIKSAPVSRIVSVVLKHAVDGQASDVHIEPVNKNSIIRFRIDGKLHNSIVLPLYIHNAIIARVKVMANMKIDETRIPQDGRIRVKVKGERIDFRVSTLPLLDHEKVVMRVLSTPKEVPTLDELGFGGPLKKEIERQIKKPTGMILVTGPTGSGKSFTLFTFLNKINSEFINISTLEDPVEYNIDGVNQSQVRPEADFTFASGLRSLLRQDPDVIMVGEVRDNETAELAIHAALTGHLVFSTLHTNDAIGAIPRLIDMKVEPFLLSSTLNMILAQRLVRRICDNCREEFDPPNALKERVKGMLEKMPEELFYGNIKKGDKIKFYHGKGCSRCGGTGYKGRIAITETLILDRKIKNIIAEGINMENLQAELDSRNYMNIMQDGLVKVLNGLTTLEEILVAVKEV